MNNPHKAIFRHLHSARHTLWVAWLSLLMMTIHPEQMMAEAELLSNYNVEKDTYNFWLYLPDGYEKTAHDTPLIIFLHGRSLSGSDLNRVRRYGLIDVVESGRKVDAMVMAPQCPSGVSWQPQKLHKTIEWVKRHYDFDTDRIYVVGMSLGGYGTIDYCATYPDEVAAGIGMCGGASVKPSVQQNLSRMPFWIIHGTADRAVPISESKKVVENVQDSHDGDKRLKYTWLQGGDHGTPSHVFYKKETYDWLFSHALTDRDRPINRDIDFTTESLKGAYKSMARGVVDVEINHTKKARNVKRKASYTDEETEDYYGALAEDREYDDIDDIYSLPTPEELERDSDSPKEKQFKSNKIKTNENYERHNEKQTVSDTTDDDAEERSLRAGKRRDSAHDKRDKTPSAQVAEVKKVKPIEKTSTHKQGEKKSPEKDNESSTTAKKGGKIIIVRSGDTLDQIAKAYGTTVKQICSDNGIKETDILRLGQELRITKRRKTE